jgi:hypothetical protein
MFFGILEDSEGIQGMDYLAFGQVQIDSASSLKKYGSIIRVQKIPTYKVKHI